MKRIYEIDLIKSLNDINEINELNVSSNKIYVIDKKAYENNNNYSFIDIRDYHQENNINIIAFNVEEIQNNFKKYLNKIKKIKISSVSNKLYIIVFNYSEKNKGIKFRINDIFLLKEYFNPIQKIIIKTSFFTKKEKKLERLLLWGVDSFSSNK